jgi:hypothetical protein
MLHTPIITRESVIEAKRTRRARFTQKAVPDDGILHPQDRRVKRERPKDFSPRDLELSSREVFDLAKRKHPLPQVKIVEPAENDLPVEIVRAPTVERIQRAVCEHYHISMLDLLSERRTAVIVEPRQIAMYLAKMLTPRSLPDIGRRFNGKDHTTILYAVRKIAALLKEDAELAATVEKIKQRIDVGSPALACARG